MFLTKCFLCIDGCCFISFHFPHLPPLPRCCCGVKTVTSTRQQTGQWRTSFSSLPSFSFYTLYFNHYLHSSSSSIVSALFINYFSLNKEIQWNRSHWWAVKFKVSSFLIGCCIVRDDLRLTAQWPGVISISESVQDFSVLHRSVTHNRKINVTLKKCHLFDVLKTCFKKGKTQIWGKG